MEKEQLLQSIKDSSWMFDSRDLDLEKLSDGDQEDLRALGSMLVSFFNEYKDEEDPSEGLLKDVRHQNDILPLGDKKRGVVFTLYTEKVRFVLEYNDEIACYDIELLYCYELESYLLRVGVGVSGLFGFILYDSNTAEDMDRLIRIVEDLGKELGLNKSPSYRFFDEPSEK